MSSDVQKRVQTFPMHDDYIRAHCAAPVGEYGDTLTFATAAVPGT